jgi:hypothetical protein
VEIVSKQPFSETGEDHLVLLERQRLREGPLLLPGKRVPQVVVGAPIVGAERRRRSGLSVCPYIPSRSACTRRPNLRCSALGGAFFETVPLTGRVGIRRIRFLEHPAQVIEMRLRSRSLLPARPPSTSLQIHLAIKSSSLPLPAAVHCPIQAAPRARNLLGKRPLLPDYPAHQDPDRFSRARPCRQGAGPSAAPAPGQF